MGIPWVCGLASLGCATPVPVPVDVCPAVPDAWLVPCPLPPRPTTAGALAEAFIQAWQCAERANRDRERIAEGQLP